MIKNLNNKFNRNTEQQFKKHYTGDAWWGAIALAKKAAALANYGTL